MHIRTQVVASPSLAPLSRVHQRLLQQQLEALEQSGQDITILTQLAETLPRLRAALSSAERQRIDELDRNADDLGKAWQSLEMVIERYEALGGLMDTQLISAEALQHIAQCLQDCAETCGEAALRIQTRLRLLENEA